MENKKYELLKDDSIVIDGFTLYRIRAVKDFFVVKAGELGGYIEHEGCLSHEGYAWVFDDAKVYNTGKVAENGRVAGNAIVTHGSKVMGFGLVKNNAVVTDFSIIEGEVTISDNALIENSTVSENAKVRESAHVHSKAIVKGLSKVSGNVNGAVIDGLSVVGTDSYVGKGCYLKSVTLVNGADVVGENFLSDVRIGFNVETNGDIVVYTDPNHSIRMVAVSKSSNQATSWNANGTIEDIIEAQYNDEEKAKMRTLLQAHMDIYNIQ